MTLRYLVECDYPGCAETLKLGAGDITAELSRFGWQTRTDALEHICPRHRKVSDGDD